jgi:hypothetical protein
MPARVYKPCMYYLTGGIYRDTNFDTLEPDTREDYGPFPDYATALREWRSKMSWKIDTCCHRLFIYSV